MTYTHHIMNSRWNRNLNHAIGSHFYIQVGTSGRNGAAVTIFAKRDQDHAREFFKSKGIELVESVEDDMPEHGMWWHFERYGYHVPIENGSGVKKKNDTTYYGGYTFKMGNVAHEIFSKS